MRFFICFFLSAWSTILTAEEVLTLKDGRQIQINDDFTWQYLEVAKAQEKSSLVVASVIPAKTAKPSTLVDINSNRDTVQLSDSGADILIGKASYQNGELVLPVSVTNQSSSSVISVVLEYELYSIDGNRLAKGTESIWQSVKRMPDTYLRPETSVQGKTLKIKAPEFPQYRLIANIVEVETR